MRALLSVLMLTACGGSIQPGDPCAESEVGVEICEGRQRLVCETTGDPAAGYPVQWFAVGCCPGDAGTSAICPQNP